MKDTHRSFLLALILLISATMLAACGIATGEPVDTAVQPAEIPPTETSLPSAGTPEPQPVIEAGDPQHGQEIFENGGADELYKPEYAYATCHTLDGSQSEHGYAGPSLLGIATRAGDRVSDLSAEEYIRQSITDPAAYVTEGYGSKMSNVAIQWLSEEELDDLVSFLLTQDSTDDIAPPAQGNPILAADVDLNMEIAEGDAKRGRSTAVVRPSNTAV